MLESVPLLRYVSFPLQLFRQPPQGFQLVIEVVEYNQAGVSSGNFSSLIDAFLRLVDDLSKPSNECCCIRIWLACFWVLSRFKDFLVRLFVIADPYEFNESCGMPFKCHFHKNACTDLIKRMDVQYAFNLRVPPPLRRHEASV